MTRQAMNQSIKRDKRGHAQTNAVCARCLLKASRACVCIYACMNMPLIVFLFVSADRERQRSNYKNTEAEKSLRVLKQKLYEFKALI